MAKFAPSNNHPSLKRGRSLYSMVSSDIQYTNSDVYVQGDKLYDFSQDAITSSGHYSKFGRPPSWFAPGQKGPYSDSLHFARNKLNGGRQVGGTLDDDTILAGIIIL
jgi:hypothetical protein